MRLALSRLDGMELHRAAAGSGMPLIFPPTARRTGAFRTAHAQGGVMTTSYDSTGTSSNNNGNGSGMGFWKVLGIVVITLIALALLGPILKGLFWIGLVVLAIYGGYMLFRSSRSSKSDRGSTGF